MVQQTASDVWNMHREAVARVCGAGQVTALSHGTKDRIVATYTGAVLIIISFSVAHLVELRLQNTNHIFYSSQYITPHILPLKKKVISDNCVKNLMPKLTK